MSSVTLTLAREGTVTGYLGTSLFTPEIWLHAVYDRLSDVMLSCEAGNALYMGRLDLAGELRRWTRRGYVDTTDILLIDWQVILVTPDKILDHWHIFAHGRHFLTYVDKDTGTEVYAITMDTALSRASAGGDVPILGQTLSTSRVSGLVDLSSDHAYNDHFTVVSASGFYIGVIDHSDGNITIVEVTGRSPRRPRWASTDTQTRWSGTSPMAPRLGADSPPLAYRSTMS